ncbi:hypothetical protein GLYMA_15G068550v4 [Glycine max]|nr:hypothetical protein GLYMA_15G068550v4 [Glycine max]KAH1145943.1 hypothetical protein GYH30_041576 [Glycine max]
MSLLQFGFLMFFSSAFIGAPSTLARREQRGSCHDMPNCVVKPSG